MPAYFDIFLLYSPDDAASAAEFTRKLEDSGLKVWPPPHLSLSEIDTGLKITALENSKRGLMLIGKNGLDLETTEFKQMLERARADEANHNFAGDRAFSLLLGFSPSFPTEDIPLLNLPPDSQLEPSSDEEIIKTSGVVQEVFKLVFVTPTLNNADTTSNGEALAVIKSPKAKNRGKEKLLVGIGLLLIISLVFNFIQWQKPTASMANTTTQPQKIDETVGLTLFQSRELVASAAVQLNTNPDLSLLLATEALKKAATPEAENILRQAVSQPIPRLVKLANPQPAAFNSSRIYTLSPDLKRMVTISSSSEIGGKGIVELWSTENGAKLSQFSGVGGSYYSATISPNGKLLLLRNVQGSSQMWDLDSQRQLFEVKGDLFLAVFSPDGKYLAYSDQYMVQTLYSNTGKVVSSFKNPAGFNFDRNLNLNFSPDSQNLLTNFANTPQLWQVTTGKLVMEYKGHSDNILTTAFSPDGQFLATSSRDHTVNIWRVDSGKPVRTPVNIGGSNINLSFSPDGNYLAINDYPNLQIRAINNTEQFSGYYTGTLQNWSPDSKSFVLQNLTNGLEVYQVGRLMPTVTLQHPALVVASGYTSSGTEMLTVAADGVIRYWTLVNRTPMVEIEGDGAILDIIYSQDGKSMAVVGRDRVTVFDAIKRQAVTALIGNIGGVNKAQFNPAANLIATGSADGSVRIWKSDTGELITTLKVSDKEVTALSFSPNGQILAAGGEDGNIRLWQTANWQEAGLLEGHKASVTNLSFSLDSKKLVSGSNDTTAIIWEVVSGQLLQTLEGHKSAVYSTAFSPDGKLVVTGSADYSARVWEVSTGRFLFSLEGHGGTVREVKFTQDGKQIVTVAGDNRGGVWDSSNGNLIKQIGVGRGYSEFNSLVLWGKISPDNRFIVVSENDTAQVLDITSGRKIAEYNVPAGQIQFITISPDNKSIILGLSSGKSLVYQCQECGTASDLLQIAESKATRLLTEEEKAQYLH